MRVGSCFIVFQIYYLDLGFMEVYYYHLIFSEKTKSVKRFFVWPFPKNFAFAIYMHQFFLIKYVLASNHDEGVIECGADLEDLLHWLLELDVRYVAKEQHVS